MRQSLDEAQFAGRRQLAQARDRDRRAAKLRAAVHQGDAGRLGRQIERPIQRRIPATEDHELAAVEITGGLDAVVDLGALELLGRVDTQPTRLKRADPGGDHDRTGVENGPGVCCDAEAAVVPALQRHGLLTEV